jgi:hypothetical protein
MRLKIYIEADLDDDVPNELHDEQLIHEAVAENLAVLCKELDLNNVTMTRFEVEYDEEE